MQALSWYSIAFYCFFSIFVFYQQLHIKNLRGTSQGFALIINVSAFAGVFTGFAYLIYYGWYVIWWAPIVIFVIGLVASMLGFILERLVGILALSFGGFIGWPLCAYFMFSYVPING
ncbi:hypothetical protein [Limnobacter sp.]|uniref:hypothetical protein n=1 Tax=Limnobacter sp. TaxID=2003368 RepID=UPI00311F0447